MPPVCADGYFLETRELWADGGRLVAINRVRPTECRSVVVLHHR